jgi:hypothetical protein
MLQELGITPQDGLEPGPLGQDEQGEQEAAAESTIIYSGKIQDGHVYGHKDGKVSLWINRHDRVLVSIEPIDPSDVAGHLLLADLACGRPVDEVADAMRDALIAIGKRDVRELAYLLAKVGEEVYGGPEGVAA